MRHWMAMVLGMGLLAACQPGQDSDAPSGQADYMAMCAACHGATGVGDGPSAAGLSRRPADLTRLAMENGGVFPMLAVMGRIDGYTSDTGTMPEFGAILLQDTLVPFETAPGILTPTPPRLIALAEYIGTLQR